MIFDDFDKTELSRYIILFLGIAATVVLLYFASKDPSTLTENTNTYLLLIIIPLLIVLYYGLAIFKIEYGDSGKQIGMMLLTLTIFLAGIYFYSKMDTATVDVFGYITIGLFLLIFVIGLAILFYMLSNYFKSLTGWSGFIVYFIFYIPCMLIDFTKYILKEFQMTSQLIYVLFIIEIILILLYIYIPQLIDKIDRKNGTVLLEQGAFLDQSMTIGTSKLLKIPPDRLVNKTEETIYEKNYAFSMWVYLNLKPDTFVAYSKPAPIFDFGNGKLKISYYNNINDDDKKDKYIIQFTDSTKGPSTYELSLPNQKWNNFVFNCDYNKVDLFINGELIRTFYFDKNRPKIQAVDTINIGSENGLAGAICNIRYYSHNLSSTHIISNYNLLMNKNPPVFIL